MARLIGFDEAIESALPIPGTLPCPVGEPPACHIVRAAPPSDPAEPLYALEAGTLFFNAPGVAVYRCGADRLEVAARAGAADDDVIALLMATALPARAWLGGRYVLHCAGVVPALRGSALAIAGASGTGKSRLAEALLGVGARLVGDDSLALRTGGPAIAASGLPGGYHRAEPGGERSFIALAGEASVRAAPLGAIVELRTGMGPSLSRLRGADAVEAVLRQRHRPRVPEALGRSREVLVQAAGIAARVPIFAWGYDPSAPPSPTDIEMLQGLVD